ncbi:MAG: hypothetical protein BGO21_08430 [Dyadobacter sp. 50-39]|uniref:FecR family protein n=1 Tax=Dyadobacter sp. 50-39 TaxID=1895756 RepID=UPI00095C64F0|nr:FecR family protein [Dyadobacter sp. 50-39]OJV20582.1 MAG: hypothetical protein BGO21_08430 [Dyadobacter sp. 50-39]
MSKEEFLQILEKYRKGSATEEEEAFLLAYYELFESVQDRTDLKDAEQVRRLKESIKSEIDLRSAALEEVSAGGSKPGMLYRYAAWLVAATFLIVGGLYFFKSRKPAQLAKMSPIESVQKSGRIVPGSYQATLTLGNGEVIRLDDQQKGLIRQQDGVSVQKRESGHLVYSAGKTANAAVHTVSTPRGGQYQLTLSDGTTVWLNAATSIRFPAVFSDTIRSVELRGEAYFEVAHDAGKPFQVRSDGQLITVLGTRFNVAAYSDEPSTRTTLLEGKVKVMTTSPQREQRTGEGKILKPGQQSLLTGGLMQIANVDAENSVAWKNGYFRFDKADIRSVMRQIARWYDVEVEYRGKAGADLFAGEIKRDEDIANVLRIIQLNNVDVRVNGRKIIVNY